jgi:hypothetical protein
MMGVGKCYIREWLTEVSLYNMWYWKKWNYLWDKLLSLLFIACKIFRDYVECLGNMVFWRSGRSMTIQQIHHLIYINFSMFNVKFMWSCIYYRRVKFLSFKLLLSLGFCPVEQWSGLGVHETYFHTLLKVSWKLRKSLDRFLLYNLFVFG